MMQITYGTACSPIVECIGYLEQYANASWNVDLLHMFSNQTDTEFFHKETMQFFDQIITDMGAVMENTLPHAKFWFTYLPKQSNSPMSLLLPLLADPDLTMEAQFAYLRAVIKEDPCCFLRLLIDTDDLDETISGLDEHALLERLSHLDFDGECKWKLLRMHMTFSKCLNELEQLLMETLTVYHRYEARLNDYLKFYLQDLANDDHLYETLSEKRGVSFDLKQKQTILVPTIAYWKSLRIIETSLKLPHDQVLILWGIKLPQTIHLLVHANTTESICYVLKQLSEQSKFEILCYISKQKKAYGAEIAKAMKLTTATISYHMQSLIDAGFVLIEKRNNRVYYELDEAFLKEILNSVERKILLPS